MKSYLLPVSFLLLFTNSVFAQPVVTGNVISWPDDGWYQVQNESDYKEVCAGGLSCLVEPGSYVVINHTSGVRFPNIVVRDGFTPEPPEDNDADKQLGPSDIVVTVYSDTAAEIFWTPPEFTRRNPIMSNVIEREGINIATLQGYYLSSYFDADREPEKSYTYRIIANYANGESLGSAPFTTDTPPLQPSLPVADELSAEERKQLDMVFDIVDAKALKKMAAAGILFADFERNNVRPVDDASQSHLYDCPAGGTLTSAPNSSYIQSDECRIGSLVFSAGYWIDGNRIIINSGTLEDTRDNSQIEFIGQIPIFENDDSNGILLNGINAGREGFKVSSPEGSYEMDSFLFDYQSVNVFQDVTLGSATSATQVSGLIGNNARIQTLSRFDRDSAEGKPVTGTILISSDNGGSLRIDADSGNPDTFLFTSNADGVVISYELEWTDDWSINSVSSASVDLGIQ